MKKIKIKEYAEQKGKTKEAILYQIKKGKIKAEKIKNIWWVLIEKEEEKKEEEKKDNSKNNFQIQELENKIKLLEQEVKLKNEIIENKNEIISTQKEVIESEKRTIFILGKKNQNLEQKQEIILLENREVKKEIIEIKNKKNFSFLEIFKKKFLLKK